MEMIILLAALIVGLAALAVVGGYVAWNEWAKRGKNASEKGDLAKKQK